jgi:hypothetical protein
MEQGFIILQRKISENWLWLSEPFSKAQAWVDLLLLANHAEGSFFIRGVKVIIKRGQVGKSEENLSQRWKWSRGKVRTFLKLLETEQQIKQLRSPILNVIEIINYNLYQKMDNKKNSKTTTERQQKDTNKEEEIIIKEEIKNRPTLQQIKDYCKERKNSVNPEKWLNHYEANGWKVGKNSMKDWKAAVRTWESNSFRSSAKTQSKHNNFEEQDYYANTEGFEVC